MLRVAQLRLGTPEERLGDMDFVQMVAHQLNNVLTARRIAEALLRLDSPPGAPGGAIPGHSDAGFSSG